MHLLTDADSAPARAGTKGLEAHIYDLPVPMTPGSTLCHSRAREMDFSTDFKLLGLLFTKLFFVPLYAVGLCLQMVIKVS